MRHLSECQGHRDVSGVARVGRASMRAGYTKKRTVLPLLQYGVELRTAQMHAFIAAVGPTPFLEMRTGAMPLNCAMADSGRLLAEFALPEEWAVAEGAALKQTGEIWRAITISEGTAGYWRLKAMSGVVHAQGTVGSTGSGAALELDDPYLDPECVVTLQAFVISAGNA